MKVEFSKFVLSKDQLDSIPEIERSFFIRSLNFASDLSVFRKLMLYSINTEVVDEQRNIQLSQSLSLCFVLIGKLLEGWKMISKELKRKECAPIKESWEHDEEESLASLEKIFEGNLFRAFRDKASFHYDTNFIGNSYSDLKFGGIEIYLPHTSSLNLFSNFDELLLKCVFQEYIEDYEESKLGEYLQEVFPK